MDVDTVSIVWCEPAVWQWSARRFLVSSRALEDCLSLVSLFRHVFGSVFLLSKSMDS